MERPRLSFLLLVVVLALGKGVQLIVLPGWDWLRQLLLLSGVGAVVLVSVSPCRRIDSVLRWQVALPRPALAAWFDDWRWFRGLLGTLTVVLDIATGVAIFRGCGRAVIGGLAGTALALLAGLALVEVRRYRSSRGTEPGPDRAVLWVVGPATLVWAIPIVGAAIVGHQLHPSLSRAHLAATPPVANVGGALNIVVVIGLGEEYLFRGLLLVLAIRWKVHRFGFALLSLGFGLWHVPDELLKSGGCQHRVLAALGVGLATFALSQVILVPLRLRSRSVAGPGFLHAANNLLWRLL